MKDDKGMEGIPELPCGDAGPIARAAQYLSDIEARAVELHAVSCRTRGVEARWRGRRTNRAYYRRVATAMIAREHSSPRQTDDASLGGNGNSSS